MTTPLRLRLSDLLLPFIAIMGLAAIQAAAQETNPVKLVKGIVTDASTGKPVDGGMIFAFEGNNAEAAVRSRINPKTGAYQMILSPGAHYRLHIEAASYYSTDFPYVAPTGNQYQESEKNFSVKAVQLGSSLFSGGLFPQGSSQLKPSAEFRKALDFLAKQPYLSATFLVGNDAAAKPASKKKGKGASTPPPTESSTAGSLASNRASALRSYLSGADIDLERVAITTVDRITPANAKRKGVGSSDNVAILLSGVNRDIRR